MASIDSPNAAPRRMPRPWTVVVLLTAVWSLVAASRSDAHVTMTPPFVDADVKSTVSFELPNERPPHATISLEVKAPPGIELAAATPPAGWKLELEHDRARWTGGRIEGRRTVAFPLVVTARTRAGTEIFRATQGYDDGESVRWDAGLTRAPRCGRPGALSAPRPRAPRRGRRPGRHGRQLPRAAAAPPPPTSRAIAATVATVPRAVLFAQILNGDLGCASYLVGCEEAQEAVVVDPPYAIEEVLAEAERLEVRIVRTLETHTHADHVSGHGRLALEHEVPVSIHPAARAEYPHDPLEDGDEVTVGNVTLRCIHTPGHRPEHCCLAVIDRTRADEPWLVLTGDSLFVGDAARPDLAVGAAEGAEGLFHSLRRLMELPDGVEVFPGHVAGSLCGVAMSSRGSTTIGFERRFNPMASIPELDAFVAESAAVSAPKPPNLARIVELNHGPFLGAQPAPAELPLPAPGSQLLDVRPVPDHLAGHRPGGGQRSRRRHELLDEGGLRARCLHTGHGARRRRGRGRAGRARPPLRGVPRHRRVRARRRPRGHAAGDDRRARGPDRRRCDRRRRARARRAGRGLHPRQPEHPVPPDANVLPGPARRPADRDDLQLGAACGDRRQHAPREGPRRAPRRRRRDGGLARPRARLR